MSGASIELSPAALDEIARRVAELSHDEIARRVAELVADRDRPAPAAYTVATLAAELGRSERSIRDAIHDGHLAAVKRGRGYVIAAGAVREWAAPAGGPAPQRRRARATSSSKRTLAGALADTT